MLYLCGLWRFANAYIVCLSNEEAGEIMKWMHISDIHFNLKGYDAKNIREQLLVKLKELELKLDFILITGDCLFRFGKDSLNQKEIINYIKEIASTCGCSNRKVYICPGNHDIDRENGSRNELINDIRNGKENFSKKFQTLCEYGHDRFQIIHKGVTSYDYQAYKVSSPRNESYRIISIDSCLISKDKEDCQKLKVFNDKIYEIGKKIKNDKRINILIMHHGIECLELSDARKFEHWIEDSNIDLVCCGHTHRAAVNSYEDLRRDIKQFTAGAIVVDDYTIPSFYICERHNEKFQVDMSLYTYTTNTEKWILDNQLLRKFEDGKYTYELSRYKRKIMETHKSDMLKCKTTIDEFNLKYINKYGSEKIYSNKHEGFEKFNSWNIVHSLVEIGVSYTKALEMTYEVIEKITSSSFLSINTIFSCEELRDTVYNTIIHCPASATESEYDISRWASRYARKYSRDKQIMVTDKYGRQEKLNYYYIKNTLLKNVIDSITNNKIFYEKIFHNELTRMAESVLDFLKNMGIFEIREEALFELIKEYITQRPHPWLVNGNREELIAYHKEQGVNHINDLRDAKNQTLITQMEAAYHICSALLLQYDDYIGCTETSPINILATTINNISNKEQSNKFVLPMQKYQVIQMKKDFESHEISFADLKRNINILNKNIVRSQRISLKETKKVLIELWGMLMKLEKPIDKNRQEKTALERIRNIFVGAKGFVVKATLRDLKNCFWVEPNWEKYEIFQQHLGKQMLVCVLDTTEDVDLIYQYLYMQNRRENITEIVFVLKDFSAFNNENRKKIREKFKGKYLRCIFIQEENFEQISTVQSWRTIFYNVLEISKVS